MTPISAACNETSWEQKILIKLQNVGFYSNPSTACSAPSEVKICLNKWDLRADSVVLLTVALCQLNMSNWKRSTADDDYRNVNKCETLSRALLLSCISMTFRLKCLFMSPTFRLTMAESLMNCRCRRKTVHLINKARSMLGCLGGGFTSSVS